jgi:hypothetical protein
MPGHSCDLCRPFLEAVRHGLSDVEMAQLEWNCSRHKAWVAPPDTPDGFWDLSFADSM